MSTKNQKNAATVESTSTTAAADTTVITPRIINSDNIDDFTGLYDKILSPISSSSSSSGGSS